MRHLGRDGVAFWIVAMVVQSLYFGAVDFPSMTPGERAVDTTIGVCFYAALALWALQMASRR